VQNVGTTSVHFPVGPNTASYNPVSILQESGMDAYAVRVKTGVDNPIGTPGMVNRQWTIDRSDVNVFEATVAFQWNSPAHETGTFDPAMSEVFQWDGVLWNPLGAGAAMCAGGVCVRTEDGISDFSPFAIAGNVSLPVTLLSFGATLQKDKTVLLQWSTTDEENNARFELERSTNTRDWVVIDETPGVNKPGIWHYSSVDALPQKGTRYYRLRQIDHDGQHQYSNIAVIRTEVLYSKWHIGPIPATSSLTINLGETHPVTLSLFDLCGRVLFREVLTEENTVIDISDLPDGAFLLKLSNSETELIQRIIKM
jgi:hypothetical protein